MRTKPPDFGGQVGCPPLPALAPSARKDDACFTRLPTAGQIHPNRTLAVLAGRETSGARLQILQQTRDAASKSSEFFQFEKSGMKYSRISRAASIPGSGSNFNYPASISNQRHGKFAARGAQFLATFWTTTIRVWPTP